ncbi:MAG TPA: GGDEF domain-containing protein [Acidobacteriaceae bacterium]|jgi:diguanylate cyclase (GGDEF)-like protein
MTPRFHLDIDTLLASETLICVMFALVLYVVSRHVADAPGPKRLAQAFIASGFGTFFFLMSSGLPLTVSVMVANSALMAANLLFYDGVDHLLHVKPRLLYPALIALATLFALFWFTAVNNNASGRIMVLSLADCLMQIWLFLDLIHCARKAITVYLLAISVGLSMATDFLRALATALGGTELIFLNHGFALAVYMVTGILAACGLGIFSLMLVAEEIMKSMERSARSDALTGALNRRGIEEVLKSELDRASRSGTPLTVALIDIDEFKTVNDTWGHPFGDMILRDVASCIISNLRSYDTCGRIGGDEFMVILPGSSATASAQICERILHQVAGLPPRRRGALSPTVSLGFTEYDPSDTPESIVARADRALYDAKRHGRNRVSRLLKSIYAQPDMPALPPPRSTRAYSAIGPASQPDIVRT